MKGSITNKQLLIISLGLLMSILTVQVSATVVASSYLLDVGDVVEISVWGHSELKTAVEIRPDGHITFPLVGDYLASGKTTTQLANEIQTELGAFVVKPSVSVIVTKFRTISVQVLGEVRIPGYYTLRSEDRLLDALGLAGGPTEEANLSQVTLTRMSADGADLLTYNVNQFIREGVASNNPTLHDGDVIFLSKSGNALVLGAVSRPGSYPVQPDMDLLDLLAVSGGALPNSDLSEAILSRTYSGILEEHKLDLHALMQSGKGTWKLQAGDVLYIPPKEGVIVFGEVKAPGNYSITATSTLLEIIGEAGGLTALGDATQINILRNVDNGQEMIEVDISNALAGKVGSGIPQLVGGDIIFVPEAINTVLVLGEVAKPGVFTVNENMGILDVLALAGSTTSNAALNRVTLTRNVNEDVHVQEIDVANLQRTGTGRNIELLPGDVIFVPEGASQALVLGRVARPGSFRLNDQINLLDLLAMAGGPLDSAGDQVLVTRDGNTEIIELGSLMRLGIGNISIEAGDVVYLTEGQHQLLVLGEVANPGYHRVEFGDRILDGIAKAGGLLDSAAADQISVTRQNDGDNLVIPVDFDQILKNRFLDSNFQLEGGDVIIVPEAIRHVMILGEVRNPGYYFFDQNQDKLLNIITLAGGMTDNAAGDQVQITRIDSENNSSITTYSVDALIKGQSTENPQILPGDVIYIPERKASVLVFGEVVSPGYYPVTATTHLLDAIGRAGGFTDRSGAQEVSLTRVVDGVTKIETIDVRAIMETGQGNIPLVGGETILVPELNMEVMVIGEVERPGMYTIRSGERIIDVLSRAGGVGLDASQNFTVTRQRGTEQDVFNFDYRSIISPGSVDSTFVLEAGDIIYVPRTNRRVLVFGEVNQPGAYLIDEYSTLLDIIALAGGTTSQAKLDDIMIASSATENLVQYIDLNAVLGRQQANPILTGGEVIQVGRSRNVLVMGEVSRPGAFTLPDGGRVLDLLALAGGLNNNNIQQEIIITRQADNDEQVWIMDYHTLINKQSESNLLLAGGDVVFVPELSNQVLVLGEVVNPGVYTIYSGARVLDAIAMADGPTDRAALESIGIYRGDDIDAPATLSMGKDRVLFEGSAHDNPQIQGGDIIYVPETSKPNWTQIFGFMGGVRTFQQIIEWFLPK